MIKLNNKGQSLVMFVLILPIILLMFALVYDIGNAILHKQELDNINYLTVEYGLDHINEDDLEGKLMDMININDNTLNEIIVLVRNDKIQITTKKSVNGMFIKNFEILEIKSSYEGYMKDNKKIIERV